jgi:hypothetical protein
MKPPALLFKYVGCEPHHFRILADLRIRFTQPDDLNDPFDCIPGIEPPGDVAAFVERAIENSVPTDPILTLAPQKLADAKRKLVATYERDLDALTHRCLEIVRRNINRVGVLSLSARNDNLVMWEHYAASHHGFVIGLKPGYAPLTKRPNEQYLSEGEVRPVTYVQERVILPADRIDLPIDLLFTKGQSWEYEEEWRVVRYLDKCDVAVPPPTGDPRVFLCDIDSAAIARVDIGELASNATITALKDATSRGSRLEHVHLYQAHLNAGRTALAFKPLN